MLAEKLNKTVLKKLVDFATDGTNGCHMNVGDDDEAVGTQFNKASQSTPWQVLNLDLGRRGAVERLGGLKAESEGGRPVAMSL